MNKPHLKNNIQDITSQLIKKYHPEKIILFGSASREKFSEGSDLDFFIIKKNVPERGIDRQYDVDLLIERHGVALDFIIFRPDEVEEAMRLGDPFIKDIIKKGKVLYG